MLDWGQFDSRKRGARGRGKAVVPKVPEAVRLGHSSGWPIAQEQRNVGQQVLSSVCHGRPSVWSTMRGALCAETDGKRPKQQKRRLKGVVVARAPRDLPRWPPTRAK